VTDTCWDSKSTVTRSTPVSASSAAVMVRLHPLQVAPRMGRVWVRACVDMEAPVKQLNPWVSCQVIIVTPVGNPKVNRMLQIAGCIENFYKNVIKVEP
jgi:hypothetical protein